MYLDGDAPLIAASARKHGIDDDDMLHAYRNPMRVFRSEDLTMIVGAGRAGEPIEVGVVETADRDVVVHAMAARPKFLR